jgi:DNA-binding response OmpR family regulator
MRVLRVPINVGETAASSRTVLILSEDLEWRTAVGLTLEGEGYVVLTARHAGHALLTCARHDGAIDLLITEEVTPDGRGRTIAKTLRAEQPGMRVLLFGNRPTERDKLLAAVRSAFV